LVDIPRRGSGRRHYDRFRLLSEIGSAETPDYTVPADGLAIPRHFFTNLWVWVLSDAEIAVYLALLETRARRTTRHEQHGIFITSGHQDTHYAMQRATWRSTDMLFRLRLIDRLPASGRTFATGKIGNPVHTAKGAKKPVVRFRVNDKALQANALTTALQVLTAPNEADGIRRERGPLVEQSFLLGTQD
jgi:hypothetical protein